MQIVYVAILIFTITTVLGLYLSSFVFRKKNTPKSVIIAHGVLSVVGFILLCFFCPHSFESIFFFLAATACGIILLYQDLTGKKFTKWLCIAHAILSGIGLVFLVQLSC